MSEVWKRSAYEERVPAIPSDSNGRSLATLRLDQALQETDIA